MVKVFAVFATLIATSMSAIAAWDRGGNDLDRALLIGISIIIVLAVHLLPALSKRSYVWIVWSVCLCGAIYGHLTFLTHANVRAGEVRAEQSVLTVGTERQIQIIQSELDAIQARPIATVAAELAVTESRRARAALREEIAEAKRAEGLKEQLVKLYGVVTVAKITGATDPVTAKISEVTGYNEGSVTLVIGLTFSILLELIGALLWFEALNTKGKTVTTKVVASKPVTVTENVTTVTELPGSQPVTDPIAVLQTAIEAGECKRTVAGIRSYFKCSQTKAMELRRQLGGFPTYQ